MTPNEFKAWFDGFTEAFESRIPTKAQWARIKERVAEIDGKRVTETVYVDRYVRTYPSWQYLGNFGTGTAIGNMTATSNGAMQQYSQVLGANNVSNQIGSAFNSMQAMAELGRAEATELA